MGNEEVCFSPCYGHSDALAFAAALWATAMVKDGEK